MQVKGRPKGDVGRYMGLLLVNPESFAMRLLDMGADTKHFLLGVERRCWDPGESMLSIERSVME